MTKGMKIAFISKSRIVKSWATRYLVQEHGFKEKGLEDTVKQILKTIHGIGVHDHHTIRFEKVLRYYDAWYKIDPNLWIQHLGKKLNHRESPEFSNIVIDDARYLNELEELKRWGFTIVRLTTDHINTHHLGKNLMGAAPGNLIVNEWYNKNFSDIAGVDYSIFITQKIHRLASLYRQETLKVPQAKDLDQLVENLTSRQRLLYNEYDLIK